MSLMNTENVDDCNSEHIAPRYAIFDRAMHLRTTHVNHAYKRGCIRSECTFVCNRPQKEAFLEDEEENLPAPRSFSSSLPSRTGFKIRAVQQQHNHHFSGRMAGPWKKHIGIPWRTKMK